MKARDLAIIFAPTILGQKAGLLVLVNEDIGLKVRVVDTIISNTFSIFDDDDEVEWDNPPQELGTKSAV
jgi:hypothetical protein